ncbi:MAG TPA: energy transducer TonB [Opitutaceae bacterium]|nr:energy transducer TonB [Opitutaceae bacterium]
MKYSKFLLAAALAGALVSSRAFAAPTAAPAAKQLPVLVKVVHPTQLPPSFKDAGVTVSFELDEHGVPHQVAMVTYVPDTVAKHLLPAVAQWRFTPMLENGKPVKTRVIMPLKLVEGTERFASSAPNPGSVNN